MSKAGLQCDIKRVRYNTCMYNFKKNRRGKTILKVLSNENRGGSNSKLVSIDQFLCSSSPLMMVPIGARKRTLAGKQFIIMVLRFLISILISKTKLLVNMS
jgi:hypothetical protein